MPVRRIAALFAAGSTVEEIVRDFPQLTSAQIHDAISYALDHPHVIAYHEEGDRLREILRRHNLIYYEGRTLLPQHFAALDLPADAVYCTWETLPPELDE